jgi:hypothetical protein
LKPDLERALNLFGWMTEPELRWLAFEASRHKVVVEIGSYMGRSGRCLGDNAAGVVYCVDHWEGPPEINPPPHPKETLYPTFLENLKDLVGRKVFPVKKASLDAAANWDKMGFPRPDMVFIDGSHDYENVRKDVEAWSKLLVQGGLLSGHDSHWLGIQEMRRLVLPEHMTGVGGIWAVDNFDPAELRWGS